MAYSWPPALSDVKSELRIPTTDTSDDASLQIVLDGSVRVVEHLVGDVSSTSYTENYDGGSWLIMLRHTPVISVQSVTEYLGRTAYTITSQPLGQTVDNYGYDLVDAKAGKLVRRSGAGTPMTWLGGDQGVVISYTAGRSTVPANIYQGCLELVRVNFQPQQGFSPVFGTPADEVPGPGGGQYIFGFYVPTRVRELLLPDQSLPGIA